MNNGQLVFIQDIITEPVGIIVYSKMSGLETVFQTEYNDALSFLNENEAEKTEFYNGYSIEIIQNGNAKSYLATNLKNNEVELCCFAVDGLEDGMVKIKAKIDNRIKTI